MISMKQGEEVLVNAPEEDCVAVLSPPGFGKTSMIVNVAARKGYTYLEGFTATREAVEVRLPFLEPGLNGIQLIGSGAPTWIPIQALAEQYKGKRFLVGLDDFPQSQGPVQRAVSRAFYHNAKERLIGDFPVYENVQFVITGNREQDRAGANRFDTYVSGRVTYLEVEPTVDEWCSGAIAKFPVPPKDSDAEARRERIRKAVALGIPETLIAYGKWTKQIHNFNPEARSSLNPRSLERLGRFMRAFESEGIDGALLQEVATGTIGEAEAVKFIAFHKLRDQLPDTDAILRGQDVPLPPKTEVLYILVTAIVRAARKEHIKAIAKLVRRLAEVTDKDGHNVGVEISAYLLGECMHGSCSKEVHGIGEQPEVIKWLSKNYNYFRD